jgi:hypothetical protein
VNLPGRDRVDRLVESAGLDPAPILRRGVLALAALGVVGTTIELVFLRHWTSRTELFVWPAMLLLAFAVWMVARRPTRTGIRGARWLSVVVLLIAGLGVALHVHANLEAAPLDQAYETTWTTLSVVEQWWLAITGGVGPAPTLAPGALAEIALMIMLATLAHPALRKPTDRAAAAAVS